MASSVVEICNRALDAIGVQPITAITEETKAGGLCRRYYPQIRDDVIRGHPWKNHVHQRAILLRQLVEERVDQQRFAQAGCSRQHGPTAAILDSIA